MRGVTNALPAGGGLSIIAEGTLSTSQSASISISLKKPAIFVLVGANYSTMLFPNDEMVTVDGTSGTTSMRFWLSTDGQTLSYASSQNHYGATSNYRAVG